MPKPDGYPLELRTLGDHLRRARMDKGLLQRDVAELFGVCEETITNWESRGKAMQSLYYPALVDFLGYCPGEVIQTEYNEPILRYRHTHDLSQKAFAKLVGVDAETIARIERSGVRPSDRVWGKVQLVVSSSD